METVGRRLKKLIETEAATLQEFCDKFGFVYNSIQPITKDKRELGINIVKELAQKIPGLNTHWLLFGEGQMKFSLYAENARENAVSEPGTADNLMEEVLLQYLSSKKVRDKIGEIVLEKLTALQTAENNPEHTEKAANPAAKSLPYPKQGRKKKD